MGQVHVGSGAAFRSQLRRFPDIFLTGRENHLDVVRYTFWKLPGTIIIN